MMMGLPRDHKLEIQKGFVFFACPRIVFYSQRRHPDLSQTNGLRLDGLIDLSLFVTMCHQQQQQPTF